ncbi:MAG TPA: AraC family transcriptional regulator [Acidobacteriaceae bacterium]
MSESIFMDRLSPFFENFTLSARVFFSGQLCGLSNDHVTATAGHLHVLRSGVLKILQASGPPITISEPTVLFYPRPRRHIFQADRADATDLLCAFVEFGAGMLNPLTSALPEPLIVPLHSVPGLAPTVQLLFAEAFSQRDGRQTAVDRLTEYFLVLLLRAAMDAHLMQGGILSGLADSRLAEVIHAMHEHPENPWSLEDLARIAGMSRDRFAKHFHKVVGVTPFGYLAAWRIGVAQALLKKGESLKVVAPNVGYASSAALTRAFCQHVGLSPTEWIANMRS